MDFHHGNSGCVFISFFTVHLSCSLAGLPARSVVLVFLFDLGSVDLESTPFPRTFSLAYRCWFLVGHFRLLVCHPLDVFVTLLSAFVEFQGCCVPRFARGQLLILFLRAFFCSLDAS